MQSNRPRFKVACAAVLLTGFGISSAASGAVIFSAVDAVIDEGGPGFGNIADTFNQNGLSTKYTANVTDFDAYIASNPRHTLLFSDAEWFSNLETKSAVVTYDLGANRGFDRFALWNEESSGIGLLNLLVSVDGLNFATVLSGIAPFDNPLLDYGPEVFSFGTVFGRYVRLEMSNCPQPDPGAFAACAIGEIGFRAADVGVPEPGTLALLGLGLVGVGIGRKRRRTQV